MRHGIVLGQRSLRCVLMGVIGWSLLAPAWGGTLNGNAWIEKVKGRPGDYLELYEWNIFAAATGVNGKSFRVGLPPNPRAFYTFDLQSGTYALLLDQALFWGRPKVAHSISVPASGTVSLNVELPADYSCAFGDKSGPWGNEPWTPFGTPWYQTFVATGTSITGIVFKMAGTNTSQISVSIHRDNGGNVTTWPQVGISRSVFGVGALNDNWTRFRSGDIPTTPGQRYALKLTGVGGSPNGEFAICRRIEDGQGYAGGQAYNSAGQAQNYDLYAIVHSDNDGTVIPYCAQLSDGGDLAGWAGVWSQAIRAKGNGMAGAVLYFAGGDTWEKDITFKVRSGGPSGPQVGPSKTGRGAYQAGSNGHVGVAWNPGEVALTPGQIYWLEASHPTGFNPARFTSAANVYPDGDAYQSFGLRQGVDLHMQVVEYANVTPPALSRAPASFSRSVVRGENLPNDNFTVTNTGGGLMSYTISESVNWLSVDPTSGSSMGEADSISVAYSASALSIGDYIGTITIDAPGATGSPQTVTVNLSVTPPPFAPADADQDGDVDLDDFGRFQVCYSGAGVIQNQPDCQWARLDEDEDVDLADFGKFQVCLSGANVEADVLCAD